MKIRTIVSSAIILAAAASPAALTSDTNTPGNVDNAAIENLKSEVITLKQLITDLKVENRNLRELVQKLSRQNTQFLETTSSTCRERKTAMTRKLDALKSLGYENTHPDIVNISRQLGEVDLQCASEPSALTVCVERLTRMQAKLDELRSLGFIDKHPDVMNVTRQIAEVKNECQASGR